MQASDGHKLVLMGRGRKGEYNKCSLTATPSPRGGRRRKGFLGTVYMFSVLGNSLQGLKG